MKLIAILLMAVIFAAGAAAQVHVDSCTDLGYDFEKEGGVGSPDTECLEAGYDFGIAKWEYTEGTYVKVYEKPGYTTSVTGCDEHATWTSVPDAAGVLSKEGQCYQELEGGAGGEFGMIRYGISHVTLCGDDPREKVPEFSTLGAAVVLAGAGLFILLKRR